MILKDFIIEQIESALELLGEVKDRPPVLLEYARDEKFGDYACTLAMDKRFREAYAEKNPEFKNPRNFSTALVEKMEEANKDAGVFEKIEIAGPGFINLTVSAELLWFCLKEANDEADNFGRSKKETPRKILFEFVSANPTGPLNIVSARAAALGDACCNLLDAAGDQVHREFYVNNYGNQVDLLGHSVMLRYLESQGVTIKMPEKDEKGELYHPDGPGLPFPTGGYQGDYVTEAMPEIMKSNPELVPSAEVVEQAKKMGAENNPPLDALEQLGLLEQALSLSVSTTEKFIAGQAKALEGFRVKFDNFYRERELHESGQVIKARESIKEHVYEEEGKAFFRSTDYTDDKDRVIVRADGRPTYLLADIAYHNTKIERGFDHIWNIWGPDHHGYIARLSGAMQALGHPEDGFRVLIAQQVKMLDDGKPIKVSKRLGTMITMQTLMDEIPVDVSRYFFVMRSFESHLDYDMKEALDESSKNPYYYVAYAHARICSIFRKAAEQELAPMGDADWAAGPAEKLELTPERRRLMWLAARFPEEIRDIAQSLEPHRMTTYLYNLASALSKFYAPKENQIIKQTPEQAALLLSLLGTVGLVLKNGLNLLGTEAPESMKREEEPVISE